MPRRALATALLVCSTAGLGVFLAPAATLADTSLTATEERWINAASPVLDYADSLGVPVDIIVQPQPGDVPMAMGFDAGRCKLVLSLRDNPKAEAILSGIDDAQRDVAIETMAAHELAHCLRRVTGEWHTTPAGFTAMSAAPKVAASDSTVCTTREHIEQTRREEGFADVFGLAWTLQRHPERYAQTHEWIQRVRTQDSSPGDPHDTRAWLRLAGRRTAFDAQLPLFEQAQAVWKRGLAAAHLSGL